MIETILREKFRETIRRWFSRNEIRPKRFGLIIDEIDKPRSSYYYIKGSFYIEKERFEFSDWVFDTNFAFRKFARELAYKAIEIFVNSFTSTLIEKEIRNKFIYCREKDKKILEKIPNNLKEYFTGGKKYFLIRGRLKSINPGKFLLEKGKNDVILFTPIELKEKEVEKVTHLYFPEIYPDKIYIYLLKAKDFAKIKRKIETETTVREVYRKRKNIPIPNLEKLEKVMNELRLLEKERELIKKYCTGCGSTCEVEIEVYETNEDIIVENIVAGCESGWTREEVLYLDKEIKIYNERNYYATYPDKCTTDCKSIYCVLPSSSKNRVANILTKIQFVSYWPTKRTKIVHKLYRLTNFKNKEERDKYFSSL